MAKDAAPSGGPRSADPGSRAARTARVDALVREIFSRHAPRAALVATGGYGRGELAPRSDVDLLVLRRSDSEAGPLEAFVRALWDAGLEPGSAVRTLEQTESALANDLHAATATLEGRFLGGDRALFDELVRAVEERFLPSNARRFVKAKLDEASERHAKKGGTIFLLDPDLKEGRGTLRDLELARLLAALAPWLGHEEARVEGTDGFVLRAFPRSLEALDRWLSLGAARVRSLERAGALLAATRAALHEIEPVRTERLGKAVQETIATRFGYRARAGRLGVENFLRDVFLSAKEVDRTLRLARDKVERSLERRAGRTQKLARGIVASGSEVSLEAPVTLENAAELFLIAQRTKRDVSLATREAIRRALAQDEAALDRFRTDPATVRAFRNVLAGATHVAATLRAMHDAGYLDELLPEFGALDALAQADPYHAYTVDEHTLAAVAALEGAPAAPDGGTLAAKPSPEREDRVREELLHRTARRDLLRLGLLLHDSGKTGGSLGHVERGVALVPEAARRLGLALDEERHVRFLVEHHLTLSKLVDERDVDAKETRAQLLRACERDLERLDHLYLMTVADVRAVSPRAFTRWKDTLMTRLWEAAREEAQRGEQPHRARDDEETTTELLPRLPSGVTEDDLREHLALCPRPYLVECDPEAILLHLELLPPLRRGEALAFRAVEEDGFDRLYVGTRDRPRLFGALCGALAAEGLNIVAAQAFTRKDGVVLDRFAVVPAAGADETVHPAPARWEAVRKTIERVLGGEDPDPLIAARARRVTLEAAPPAGRKPPVRVRVSNKISGHLTVVDVTAPDRPGLLHDLATALSDAALDIRLAKIATKGDRAVDVFYVTTAEGEKVVGAAALARIRKLVGAAARGERAR